MTTPAAGQALDQEQELAVVFTCVWCGKKVEIQTSTERDELVDAQAFVAQHAECLRRISHPGD